MTIVKMDEKGRIQLPTQVRKAWKLKPKQAMSVEMEPEAVIVRKVHKLDPHTDPLLRDILINPGHSKVKVTKSLRKRLEEEQWSS